MPEPHRPSDRSPDDRRTDHAGLARLSETLVPSLVQKLNSSGLGELEVREGDWTIRLRRPAGTAPAARRERPRPGTHAPVRAPANPPAAGIATDPLRTMVASPAVGVFRAVSPAGSSVRVGDRIGVVDLLGIPQDVVAPVDGLVLEILVQTGDAVEYGEEVAAIQGPARDPVDAPGELAAGGEG